MQQTMVILLTTFFLVLDIAQANPFREHSDYCIQSGGAVEKMSAKLGFHSGQAIEGYSKYFCNFRLKDGFVVIGLETFSSKKPSLAATYIKKLDAIKKDSTLLQGNYDNPSLNFCKNIGGAAIAFLLQGGFTNELGQTDICVFGDGSMVSSWSLIYMANHEEGYEWIKQNVKAQALDGLSFENH